MTKQPIDQATNDRFSTLLIITSIVIMLLLVLHIGVGSVFIAPVDVLAALMGNAVEDTHNSIVNDVRLPRALLAMTIGAMLGLSGALIQGVTRNPLASPSLTGVLSGGVLAVVLWIAFAPEALQSSRVIPLAAMGGGLITGVLVYSLAWQRGADPVRLTLAGVLVAAVFSSLTSLILLFDGQNMGNILLWVIGSLNGRTWTHWQMLWPYAIIALPLGLLCASLTNVMNLGDEMSAGLGLAVEATRAGLLLVAVVLAAGAVSVGGNIIFIGLIAPHIARRIVGSDYRRLLPFVALFAGGLLLGADIIARGITLTIYPGQQTYIGNLPVGAVTALLGSLFFFYLLTRKDA
ncbi:MAG: iron ABC transporter permease [Chloroflexota bacterium]